MLGISDVLRSLAEQNMGGGFCIKAVLRYTLLYDVCFSFCLALARPLFCNEQILFLSWLKKEGLGVNFLNQDTGMIFLFIYNAINQKVFLVGKIS